jgi:hypothetical protein
MHEHRYAVGASQAFCEADVVGVAVSQDESADVVDGLAQRTELALQIPPMAGQSSVDERDALVGVDEVARHEIVTEAVQMGCEFHGTSFGSLAGEWTSRARAAAVIASPSGRAVR